MNKPKFNIDAHAYWLLCKGQQVEVDGQKIQLTIVEEAKKTINLHTDSWAVLNDGSQRFKDTVIKWLNDNRDLCLESTQKWYYGIGKSNIVSSAPKECIFTHILTIDEFCAIAYPEKEEVTDTPPVKCLKYEDCFERVLCLHQDAISQALNGLQLLFKTNPRQAKQLAAIIKLMTIMHDANGGEWVPTKEESRYLISYDKSYKQITFLLQLTTLNSPIYFRDYETAKRAYEENKEIFHDYFGINE